MAINSKSRKELKSYFVKNAIPTEGNFAELIDAPLNQADDGVFKLPGEPLSVVAAPGEQKRTLRLYASYPAANPDWLISLAPAQDPGNPATVRPGFGIADGAGNTRLFIDPSGNLGVGTNTPSARLDVVGTLRVRDRLTVDSDAKVAGKLAVGRTGANATLHVGGNLRLDVGEGLEILGENHYFAQDLDARILRMIDYNGSGGLVDGGLLVEGFTETDSARKPILAVRGDGRVGIGTVQPSGILDVRMEGAQPLWDRFVVTATPAWGDANAKYVTIGAGGAAGIMLSNPHVVWRDGRASVRFGRTGGVAGGTWWDVGARPDGTFSFAASDDGGLADLLMVGKTGAVTTRGDLRVNGGRLRNSSNFSMLQTDAIDWLRINPDESFPKVAIYKSVAIGSGGLCVGEWKELPVGNLRVTNSATILGITTVSGNDGVLDVEGVDHAYIQFYPTKKSAGRKGWIGYGGANTTTLSVTSQAGPLSLNGTTVSANGSEVVTQANVPKIRTGSTPETAIANGVGDRMLRHNITFGYTFASPPAVTVSLSILDIEHSRNLRIRAYAEAVTTTGCTIVLHTWSDTLVYRVAATWLAIGL